MAHSNLREILDSVAARIAADFEASQLVQHRGSKGTVRESGLRKAFLEKYLTNVVDVVGSGEVVSFDGQVSGQCDVMMVDPATPPLWDEEDYRVIPAECVDGVVEVKSNLTAGELRQAWAGIEKVKALPKTAYRAQGLIQYATSLYGRQWDHWPTLGFVFGYNGATIQTLGETFVELVQAQPDAALRVDALFVLNRGVVMWQQPETGNFSATGRPGDVVVAAEASPTEVLLQMTAHLNVLFSQVNRRVFDPVPYLAGDMGQVVGRWRT